MILIMHVIVDDTVSKLSCVLLFRMMDVDINAGVSKFERMLLWSMIDAVVDVL